MESIMTKRNIPIIQIAATVDEDQKVLFALREDGEIYAYFQGKWHQIKPVPDEELTEVTWVPSLTQR
jgi:hypothetical protein